MTDATIIQILSRFAAHQACPSLGYAQPCCQPGFMLTAPWDRWACKELVGNRESDLSAPLHTQHLLMSHLPSEGRRGSSFQTLLFSGHSSPEPSCSPSCPHPTAITPTRAHLWGKPSMPYTTATHPSLPCCCQTQGFWKQPSHCVSLCNLSGSTCQTLSTISNCTCPCPAQHQVLAGSSKDLLHKALSPKALEQLSPRPRSTFKHTHNTDIPTLCASIST